ncbi:MAG: hypothetical protein ACRD0P_29660, partial [Stackebrandtia sp.]
MTSQFKSDLAALATEVNSVDLRDRVLTGSRRLGLQRAVVGCVALTVLLFGGTVAGASVWGTDDHVAPAGSPSLLGDLYFFANLADKSVLMRQASDGTLDTVFEMEGMLENAPAVSPDGRYAVWSTTSFGDGEDEFVSVMLLTIATGEVEELYKYGEPAFGCPQPLWAPDGSATVIAPSEPDPDTLWAYHVDAGDAADLVDFAQVTDQMGSCTPKLAMGPDGGYDVYVDEVNDDTL